MLKCSVITHHVRLPVRSSLTLLFFVRAQHNTLDKHWSHPSTPAAFNCDETTKGKRQECGQQAPCPGMSLKPEKSPHSRQSHAWLLTLTLCLHLYLRGALFSHVLCAFSPFCRHSGYQPQNCHAHIASYPALPAHMDPGSHTTCEVGQAVSFVQTWKLRLREARWFGHTIGLIRDRAGTGLMTSESCSSAVSTAQPAAAHHSSPSDAGP